MIQTFRMLAERVAEFNRYTCHAVEDAFGLGTRGDYSALFAPRAREEPKDGWDCWWAHPSGAGPTYQAVGGEAAQEARVYALLLAGELARDGQIKINH